jgi:hypothetical protein
MLISSGAKRAPGTLFIIIVVIINQKNQLMNKL